MNPPDRPRVLVLRPGSIQSSFPIYQPTEGDKVAARKGTVQVATEYLKQWVMGSTEHRVLRPKPEFAGLAERNYNLKNKQVRKFLQWEEQTFGINLGWTDDAEPATAKRVMRW